MSSDVRFVGDYLILGEIASGGMGVVYRARQISLNRGVALKMIRSELLSGTEAVRRFRTEAEVAANLNHPHIVPVHEVGQFEGQHFLCMPLVDGTSMAEIGRDHRERDLSWMRRIVRWLETVADAVQHAHDRGVIHRDLKPSNILISEQDDQPHVTDFGIAKVLEGSSELTATGTLLGTPSYMAPEQVTGIQKLVTTAADVYSLGAILYELLTGRPPFRGESPLDTIDLVRHAKPRPPRELNSAIPHDLEVICLKCLEKEPRHRYPSARAFGEELGRWQRGEPIIGRSVPAWERAWKWTRRHPAVSALLVTTALVTVAGFIAVSWQRDRALSAAEQTRDLLVRSYVDRGLRLVADGRAADSLTYLAEALRSDRQARLTNHEPAHLLRLGQALRKLPELVHYLPHPKPVLGVLFSPDGQILATLSRDSMVRLWNVKTGKLVTSLREQKPDDQERLDEVGFRPLAFSSDGRRLVSVTGRNAVRVWSISGEPLTAEMAHQDRITRVIFDSTGELLATASLDGTARLWKSATGEPASPPLQHASPVEDLAFAPQGGLLAANCTADGESAVVWEISSAKRVWNWTKGNGGRALRFSSDGRLFGLATRNGEARIWETSGWKERAVASHHTDVWALGFSPDGSKFITGSDAHWARVWRTANASPITAELRHDATVVHAEFSPDSQLALTTSYDQTVRLWNTETGQPFCPPLVHGAWVLHATFSPDGTRVASAGFDQAVRIWDLTTVTPDYASSSFRYGAEKFEVPMNHVAFAPDSERVAMVNSNTQGWIWNPLEESMAGLKPKSVLGRNYFTAEFSLDGRRLVVSEDYGGARIFDALSAEELHHLEHSNLVTMARFSPDGRRVATASWDGAGRLWDASTGKGTYELRHGSEVNSIEFSPDGSQVVTASNDRTARLWSAATGQSIGPPLQHEGEVATATFSPDGTVVATAAFDSTAQLWDTTTGMRVHPPLRHSQRVVCAAFSSDNRHLATGSLDRTVRIWDVQSGELVGAPLPHDNAVQVVNFHPGGRYLLATPFDAPARVWDLVTGLPLTPPLHDRLIYATFSPDSKRLATCSKDGSARIWNFEAETRNAEVLIDLCTVLGGRRLDRSGNVAPISPKEVEETWHRVAPRLTGREEQATHQRIQAWHRRGLRNARNSGNSTAAAFHQQRLSELGTLSTPSTGDNLSSPAP